MKKTTMAAAGVALAAMAYLPPVQAQAQEYPSRSIRIILPFSPGAGTDLLARLLSQRFYANWGHTVTVDNRPGAGGNIGAEMVVKSPPDGYTLLMSTASLAVNVTLYPKMPFSLQKDLAPITQVAYAPIVVVVHPSVPARTTKEFLALAKARPGELNFGTAGAGSSTHMIGELFKVVAGVNLTHVPYKGSAPAMVDLLGGQIHLMFENLPVAIQNVRAGKIRAIGVTSRQRSASIPEVPTIAESGVPEYEATAWFTIGAGAKVPADIVRKLNGDIDAWIKAPDMQAKWKEMGVMPLGGPPEAAAKFFAIETVKWNRVIKAANIRGD